METDTRKRDAKKVIREELEEPFVVDRFGHLGPLCIGFKKHKTGIRKFFSPFLPLAFISFEEDYIEVCVCSEVSKNQTLLDKLYRCLKRAEKRMENYEIKLKLN